jgi:hypothetical protein
VGETTFEYDLFIASAENAEAFLEALESFSLTAPTAETVASWRHESPGRADFFGVLRRVGKGRLAHRLAARELEPPEFVRAALRYLAAIDART